MQQMLSNTHFKVLLEIEISEENTDYKDVKISPVAQKLMSENNIKKFLQYHHMQVIDDNKRAHKMTRMHVKYFNNPADYNELAEMNAMNFETERLLTVEIAESELERIADFEEVKSIEWPDNKYRVIYADPPWQYSNSGAIGDSDNYGRAEKHYQTMPTDDICALDVTIILI